MSIVEWLARAHAVTDAATSGPWKLWAMEVMADPVGNSNLDDAIPVAFTSMRNEDGRSRTFDATFIAASRTMFPAAVAAIEAVLALHKPDRPGDPEDTQCAGCLEVDPGGYVPWPCPTVRAITASPDLS